MSFRFFARPLFSRTAFIRTPFKTSGLTLALLCAAGLQAATAAPPMRAANIDYRDTSPDTWAATDALGRTLPQQGEAGGPRGGKFVGIFYHLWEPSEQVYDLTKIAAGAEPYGPSPEFHWWGEPYFGYYYRDDEFIMRQHAQMLSDAGVDTLFLDFSNGIGPTTKDFGRLLQLSEVYLQMRAEGRKTPQLSFLTGDDAGLSGETTNFLYDNYYARSQYASLWFQWQGRPLILANLQNVSPQAQAFFTTRRSWAWTAPNSWFGDGFDRWPWLDNYPQGPGWHDSPGRAEQLTVGVAQHPLSNIGRSYTNGVQPAWPAPAYGLYFAEQWRRVREVDPEFVFVTGWNEWIAQRLIKGVHGAPERMLGQPINDGDSFFVDAYSQEFSRDIEPMRGGHGDSYYYQLVDGIRRFKGVRAVPPPSAPTTIAINGDFSPWNFVSPVYIDDIGDTLHRNRPGAGQRSYSNFSGRNDLAVMRVARDASNLYFYARSRAPLTAPSERWMTLYLNTDQNGNSGGNGFEYVINRVLLNDHTGLLERHIGGNQWQPVAEVPFVYSNNELHFALPRAWVGLEANPLGFDFKWADNGPADGDPIGFIDQGDAAPNGRFAYRYQEAAALKRAAGVAGRR